MALTSAQAIQELIDNSSSYTTKDDLLRLVKQISVEASGRTTVLYSGEMQDGTNASDIIQNMLKNGENIRVIDDTEAAKFLNLSKNPVLQDKILTIFGDISGSEAKDFLYNAKSENGAWAAVSKNFAEATVGEVRVIAPNGDIANAV